MRRRQFVPRRLLLEIPRTTPDMVFDSDVRSGAGAALALGERTRGRDGVRESSGYFDCDQGQIYSVLHKAPEARCAVLLCGPFGAERERAYSTLVAWSRALAAQGFDALRFDYSGCGESTGNFEDMTISRWREDAELCAERLARVSPRIPLVLHGVRMGGLIAAELFASGLGDGLLLWSPPASAEAMLLETMRHDLMTHLVGGARPAGMRAEWIAALERGETIDMDGYVWSRELWHDAQRHALLFPPENEQRPWHELHVGRPDESAQNGCGTHCEAIDADTFWRSRSTALQPRSEGFSSPSLRWLGEHGPARAKAD
jgi:alpha/beta superfamily hydrolase